MTPEQLQTLSELERELDGAGDLVLAAAARWQIRSGPDRQSLATVSGSWSTVTEVIDQVETALSDGARTVRIAILDGAGTQIWSRQRTVREDIMTDEIVPKTGTGTVSRDLASASIEISAQRLIGRAYETEARRFESMHDQYLGLLRENMEYRIQLGILQASARSDTVDLVAVVLPQIMEMVSNKGFSKPAFEKFLKDHPEIAPGIARLVWDDPITREALTAIIMAEPQPITEPAEDIIRQEEEEDDGQ